MFFSVSITRADIWQQKEQATGPIIVMMTCHRIWSKLIILAYDSSCINIYMNHECLQYKCGMLLISVISNNHTHTAWCDTWCETFSLFVICERLDVSLFHRHLPSSSFHDRKWVCSRTQLCCHTVQQAAHQPVVCTRHSKSSSAKNGKDTSVKAGHRQHQHDLFGPPSLILSLVTNCKQGTSQVGSSRVPTHLLHLSTPPGVCLHTYELILL